MESVTPAEGVVVSQELLLSDQLAYAYVIAVMSGVTADVVVRSVMALMHNLAHRIQRHGLPWSRRTSRAMARTGSGRRHDTARARRGLTVEGDFACSLKQVYLARPSGSPTSV